MPLNAMHEQDLIVMDKWKSVVILARLSAPVGLPPWYGKQTGDYVIAVQETS